MSTSGYCGICDTYFNADTFGKDNPHRCLSTDIKAYVVLLKQQLAASEAREKALREALSKQGFAYSTIDEYESIVGYEVNEAFRMGWAMGRTTNRVLQQLASNDKHERTL